MTDGGRELQGLPSMGGPGGGGDSSGRRDRPRGCYDCARCTGRAELSRSLGRSTEEVQHLAARCEFCGHRLHRHFHGLVRAVGLVPDPEVISVEAPPPDSPLGKLLAELGQDDDYHRHVTT